MISEKEGGSVREINVTNDAPSRSSEVRSAPHSHRGGGGVKGKGGGDSTHALYKWWKERQTRTDHQ